MQQDAADGMSYRGEIILTHTGVYNYWVEVMDGGNLVAVSRRHTVFAVGALYYVITAAYGVISVFFLWLCVMMLLGKRAYEFIVTVSSAEGGNKKNNAFALYARTERRFGKVFRLEDLIDEKKTKALGGESGGLLKVTRDFSREHNIKFKARRNGVKLAVRRQKIKMCPGDSEILGSTAPGSCSYEITLVYLDPGSWRSKDDD
jgi:hypothetical protein